MSVKWDGQLSADSIKDWAKKEISDTTDRFEALIKFFFSVSLSSIVGFVAVFKLYNETNATPNISFVFSVIFYVLSMWLLIRLTLREKKKFDSGTDLHDEFDKDFNNVKKQLLVWFFVWCGATLIAGWSIYP
jgi:hypothetical protein